MADPRVLRHLKRHILEDAEAAEGGRRVALHARLEAGRAGGASLGKIELLLRRERHVEEELRGRNGEDVSSITR